MSGKVICGDCLDIMARMPADSVDLVVTSPPYYRQRRYDGGGIGNESHVDDYINSVSSAFYECVRVTKPRGSIVFNMGDKYEYGSLLLVPYRFAMHVIEMYGVRLVNNITWIKSNPTPRQYKRRLVSSTEPFFHFTKSSKYYYDSDSFCIEPSKTASSPTAALGKKYVKLIRESSLTQTQKRNAMDGLKAVVGDVHAGRIAGFRMKILGIHSLPFGGNAGGRLTQLNKNGFTIIRMKGDTLKKDAITCSVDGTKWNDHPATYPLRLITAIVGLLSPKGSVVLDPFCGSGTTCVAAARLGRRYIGIDKSEKYCEMARRRVDESLMSMKVPA